MGTGKSSAAITYMNEHPEKRFIYITPYLDEASRIAQGCNSMHFYEPQRKSEHHGSKTLHTMELVQAGKNITTTHQAFRYYPQELLDLIREQHYTLIIDENVEVLEEINIDITDFKLALDSGWIEEYKPNTFRLIYKDYNGTAFRDLFRIMKSRDVVRMNDPNKKFFFFWRFPEEMITAFDDVFILTYLFEGQGLHHFLKIYDLPFQYIGIAHPNDTEYRFSDTENYIPSYVYDLPNKIHILENERMNHIGERYHALSLSWFSRCPELVSKLKNNMYNYYNNMTPKVPAECRMWSTYESVRSKIKGKGYTKGFLSFNTKATNRFKNRTRLAYSINIFMNVGQKLFYKDFGVDADDNIYALSVMVQWIWRSAIRDGAEIDLYIPSRRMRVMLQNWIRTVSSGGSLSDIKNNLTFGLTTSSGTLKWEDDNA